MLVFMVLMLHPGIEGESPHAPYFKFEEYKLRKDGILPRSDWLLKLPLDTLK